ncbi:DUF4317 family protein [Clostridium sp. YIM B02515]|uniref:DUF4317 family protein n=1 Tax=Clostridium rhizosphaerae TaxID=2803861 RepID=A0ABS1T7F3_9CLOT|nr:DUF4317 family protein [Clostridium rhizosphaerae]MBL4935230.1 DUF4317 family protein [Clostridium rhizosphaerae]
MNKKELNKMKKEFKLDSVLLSIKEIYNLYIKKDNLSVIHSDMTYFQMLDSEAQEIYLNNFKKIIGGSIDTKLFELSFTTENEVNETQILLTEALNSETNEDLIKHMDTLAQGLIDNYSYDADIVVTFIKGDYWSSKGRKDDEYEAIEDYVNSLPFIMGSVNKVEPFKKTLMFNYEEKEIRTSSVLDTFINLNSPIDGFMFPSFENGFANMNKVIYYNSKPKDINYKFIDNVLKCSMKLTAEEEKSCFTDIIRSVVGESIKSEVIEDIYSKLELMKEVCEEDEKPVISLNDVKNIVKDIDSKDIEILESAFEETCGKDYEFNITNILPASNAKSVKIWNDNISINMNPKNLNGIKQVKSENGTRCLVIELDDDVVIEGFKLKTED